MSIRVFDDDYFMTRALDEAQIAYEKGEVPVGAVITAENKIIARAHNLTEQLNDVTAHAEMLAFTSASESMGGKFLNECTLYVTLEPCVMCAGASFWSRIKRLVYGASDPKRGFSRFKNILHPKTQIETGLKAEESTHLLQSFFESKR